MKLQKSQRKLVHVALSTVTFLSTIIAPILNELSSTAQAATVTARSADTFIDSIGVVGHEWYDWNMITPKLKELGIRHVRGWNPDPTKAREIASSLGLKYTGTINRGESAEDFKNWVKSVGAEHFATVEGYNEPWLFVKEDWVNRTHQAQQDLWKTFKADPTTANITVAGASPVFPSDAKEMGNLRPYCEMANVHLYYGGNNPEISGEGRWGTLEWIRKENAETTCSGAPVIITETGYHNTRQTDGHTGTPDLGVVAKYVPRLYLHHFRKGVTRSFIYEVYDEGTNPDNQEDNFGLIRHDYSNKPSFDALKNMIGLLKDPGANFQPGSLDYSLEGNTNNVETFLLQKQNRNFYLAIWLGVSSFNRDTQTGFNVSSQQVTVSLPTTVTGVVIHRLSAEGKMTSTNATVSNGKLQMSVSDAVAFIEIPPTGSSTSGGTTQPSTQPSETPRARFYQHNGFTGNSQGYISGVYRADKGQLNQVGNDSITSIRVPDGFKVRVCENEGSGQGGGLCREYGPGEYNHVGADLNDKISYIEVTQQITVYKDAQFTGNSQSIPVGIHRADQGKLSTVGNDAISSLKVPQGLVARVCESEGGGLCREYGAGEYSYVGNDLNDKISYVEVKLP